MLILAIDLPIGHCEEVPDLEDGTSELYDISAPRFASQTQKSNWNNGDKSDRRARCWVTNNVCYEICPGKKARLIGEPQNSARVLTCSHNAECYEGSLWRRNNDLILCGWEEVLDRSYSHDPERYLGYKPKNFIFVPDIPRLPPAPDLPDRAGQDAILKKLQRDELIRRDAVQKKLDELKKAALEKQKEIDSEAAERLRQIAHQQRAAERRALELKAAADLKAKKEAEDLLAQKNGGGDSEDKPLEPQVPMKEKGTKKWGYGLAMLGALLLILI